MQKITNLTNESIPLFISGRIKLTLNPHESTTMDTSAIMNLPEIRSKVLIGENLTEVNPISEKMQIYG